MITGDNPLTALHVANDVEIVDRDALILDVAEDAKDETDLVFRWVYCSKIFRYSDVRLDLLMKRPLYRSIQLNQLIKQSLETMISV